MFQLSVPVSVSTLGITKLALNKALPSVKSSHRCEAMARGFGYKTYASFLDASRSDHTATATIDGDAFTIYLAEHGFVAPGSALYCATSKAALHHIAKRYPTLTRIGFGIGEWQRGDTSESRRKQFDGYRSDLFSDRSIEAFLAGLAFLGRVKRTKTIRPVTSSYWLKHVAENYDCSYPHGEKLGPVYVPNGLFIAAAIHAGFQVKPHRDEYGREMLNANFNMAKAALYDLDCEIRPNHGFAQDRRRKKERQLAARLGYQVY